MPADEVQRRRWIGYAICLAGFVLTFAAFSPGMMSPDSIASLNEGRSGIIYDQNSPLMSFIWGLLDQILEGPVLMFTLQIAIYWTAVACLWEAVYRESFLLALGAVAAAFLPHMLSQLPVIWKDVGMAVTLFLAVALIYVARKKRSRIALAISPLFLFYAFSARLNAVTAVLPIAIWSGFVATSVFDLGRSWIGSTTIGVAYFCLLILAALGAQWIITGGRTSYPFQYVMLYDLAAISLATGEPRVPSYVAEDENFSMEKLRQNYAPTTVGGLVYNEQAADGRAPMTFSEDPNDIAELRSTWRQQVFSEPLAYLAHRASVFAQLIGLRRSVSLQYWDLELTRNPSEYPIERNPANRILTGYLGAFRRPVTQSFFFRAIVWILAGVFLLYRAMRSKFSGDWAFVSVLAASSLLYIFAYFIVAPAADFRYIYWPAIASTVAVVFGIYLLRKGAVGSPADVSA